MATAQEPLLTRTEVAAILNVKPQTLGVWAMKGRHLPTIRVGDRAIRYRRSDVDRLIESRTRPVAGI